MSFKVVATNRKARHNYFLEDTYEAGIVLSGTEVKSVRNGKINLSDSYADFKNKELFLINCHISPYSHTYYDNHEPLRNHHFFCTFHSSMSIIIPFFPGFFFKKI